jgi:CubicO group peptidase (beta-lactamase class C family)
MFKRCLFSWTAFFLTVFSACQSGPRREQDRSAIQDSITRTVGRYFNKDGCGGVVLIARGDNIVYQHAFGLASIELGVPMNIDNRFRIASITKQFIAVCILQLAEKGKLGLDDDIHRFLPDFPTGHYMITIRHLLTHTSGIKNLTSIPGYYPAVIMKHMELPELINYFQNYPVEFEPGSKITYDNSGYLLLQYIIEKASGLKLADYLNRNIFIPAGMAAAELDEDNKIIPHKASGYINDSLKEDYMSMTQIACIVLSAGDMLRWHSALQQGKLISRESLLTAQSSYVLKDGTPTHYGFGWELTIKDKDTLIEHGGGISGFGGYASWYPRDTLYGVVLVNSQSISEGLLLYKVMSIVSPQLGILREIQVVDSLVEKYAGQYSFENGVYIATIQPEGDKLYMLNRYPNDKWQMHFQSDSTFYVEEQYPFQYTFTRSENRGAFYQIRIKGRGEYLEYAHKVVNP